MNPLCFHHGDSDGAMSALVMARWHAGRGWRDRVEFRVFTYSQDPLGDVAGREVWFVDCCPKPDVLREVLAAAAAVIVIDHHPEAKETVALLRTSDKLRASVLIGEQAACVLALRFALGDTLTPGSPQAKNEPAVSDLTRIARYVSDRDTWRWELPNSRGVNAWIETFRATPDGMEDATDQLAKFADEIVPTDGRMSLVAVRSQTKTLRDLARSASVVSGGDFGQAYAGNVVVRCHGQIMQSELGEYLLATFPEATVARIEYPVRDPSRVGVSLRSRADGPDVGAIARALGGGGHRNASGYTLYTLSM